MTQESRCPQCGSANITEPNHSGDRECRDCGYVFDQDEEWGDPTPSPDEEEQFEREHTDPDESVPDNSEGIWRAYEAGYASAAGYPD